MPSPRIEVPSEIVQKWQEIVNLLAEIINVPAALVMKLEPPNIKVFVSSESSGNPYDKDEVACFDPGLYCERVIRSQQQLLVPDALQDEEWKSNPDVKLGMISYLGFPIAWPDGHIFGTICVLDDKKNAYSEPYRRFLLQCRDVLQTDLKLLTSALREGEERFRLAAQAGKMYAYEWDVATDVIVRSGEIPGVLGSTGEASLTRQQLLAGVHPNDRSVFNASVSERTPESPKTQIIYRVLRPDGSIAWLEKTGRAYFDEYGSMVRMIGMVADITERKRAEEALRESEEQFRTLAEAIPQLCWMAHGDGHIFWYNQRWYTYTGTTPERMEGWGWESVHDPQTLPLVLERWKTSIATGQSFDMVFPIKAADGIFHPFLTRITPVKDSNGSVVCWFGTNTDVTELRNAQEALSEMSRKLVQAQEQERARIARELHDDISQRLAMLGIELERLQDDPSEVRTRVQELRKQTTELSNDVQALSHDLHSSQLEYLGVVAGMKSLCKEFGERQGMQIDCRHDVRSTLPAEIGLCLFRVLQEALHNAAKHSGVKRIEVQLREESDEIHLTIRDLGKGFDVEVAKKGRGLGLTSMQERARLVNGTIEIQSEPMGGTTVHVCVPHGWGGDSKRAAG